MLRALIAAGSGDAAMLLGDADMRTPPAARASSVLLGRAAAKILFSLLLARPAAAAAAAEEGAAARRRDVLRPFLPRSSDAHIPIPTSRRQVPLHADDVLLVVNTVTSSAAFREDESWLPLCLPRFNPKGFLYAHVSFVAPEVCLVLLTAQADGFPQLACRQQLAAKLQQEGELHSPPPRRRRATVRRAAPRRRRAPPARRPRVARAPPARTLRATTPPQVHCGRAGRAGSSTSSTASASSSRRRASGCTPGRSARTATARRWLQPMRRYRASTRASTLPASAHYLQVTDRETIFAWTSAEYELYVAFGLPSKPVAVAAACGAPLAQEGAAEPVPPAPQAG